MRQEDNEGGVRVERTVRRDLNFDECHECGGHDLETETNAPDGTTDDGDSVRCRECGMTGSVSCDSETEPYVIWADA